MNELIIFGDSHTSAIASGYRITPDAATSSVSIGRVFNAGQVFADLHNYDGQRISLIDDEASKRLSNVLKKNWFDANDRPSTFVVSLPLETTVLLRMKMWRMYTPWRFANARDPRSLSDGAIAAIALEHQRHSLAFVRDLCSLGLRVAVMSAPPLQRELVAGDRLDILVEVDRIARSAIESALNSAGVPLILPPPTAYTGSNRTGFLRDELKTASSNDRHHANAEYGRLMFGEITKVFQAIREDNDRRVA